MAHNKIHTAAQTKIRGNQRRMAKNAIRSASPSALKNVKKRLRTKGGWKKKQIKTMRKEIDAEAPHVRSMRMASGRAPVMESAKTHSRVWDQRWDTGGLDKTFGTKTSYGLSTRPDRWRDVAQASWQTRGIPEYRTGPSWNKKTGWGGPEKGRWYYNNRSRRWERG